MTGIAHRYPSDITVTDQFCGAGGSSLGAARKEGIRIRLALNHWKRAIATHNDNFPNADHDCTDISAADPRRYYKTDILITSPECTNHSLAAGQKRKHADQSDLFVPTTDDPEAERSRATMWDVVRFAETWRYKMIVTENVADARNWVLYDAWCVAMAKLGYSRRKELFFNSMFFHPTPQNRDRMYVVFTHDSVGRTPDLEYMPLAKCVRCNLQVNAQQAWKNRRSAGKYDSTGKRGQYLYTCPHCRNRVEPYYYAALNVIDWSLPIEKIGDRTRKPLKQRTRDRIRRGLEKHGREPIIVQLNNPSRLDSRVRAGTEPHFTQCSTEQFGVSHLDHAILPPAMLVETAHAEDGANRMSDARIVPNATQTARTSAALVLPSCNIVHTMHARSGNSPVRDARTEPLGTQTGGEDFAVAVSGTVMALRGNDNNSTSLADPLRTQVACSTQEFLVIKDSALVTLRDEAGGYVWQPLDGTIHTQVATPQSALVSRTPKLFSYTSKSLADITDAFHTQMTKEHHGIIAPPDDLDVDDCYFRMLATHEIGEAMAFPRSYKVGGKKKEIVKQYGNAVTPPVMEWIIGRCVDCLTGERYV